MVILYVISGYAILHKYGIDAVMTKSHAWFWHKYLTIPFFVFLVLHIVPYYVVRKQVKRLFVISGIVIALPVMAVYGINKYQEPEVKPPVKSGQQENKIIRCPNCPRECELKPGETGECGQYENIDGKIVPKEE